MVGLNQVGLFLSLAKDCVGKDRFMFIPRRQNVEYMASVGMSMDDLKSVILSLDESDCFGGPEPDRDDGYDEWTVAKFSPECEGDKLYLKISVKVTAERCKCLSVKLLNDGMGD